MKKLILSALIAILLTSCTELTKDKETAKYRQKNAIAMQKSAIESSEKFAILSNSFLEYKDKDQANECRKFAISKEEIMKISYHDLRKLTVDNYHFLMIYNNNLSLLKSN